MLKKWWELVNKFDRDARNLFIGADGQSGLARSQFKWRTVKALAGEGQMSPATVESLIQKFMAQGIIIQSQEDPLKFGYWEVVGTPKPKLTISNMDKKERMEKAKAVATTAP